MSDFLMPSLGADMEHGKLVQWLVETGSAVKKGDVIAVVETHKGAFEIDIFEDGVVSELCAREGDELPVGAVLARLGRPGEETATPERVVEAPPLTVPELGPAPIVGAEYPPGTRPKKPKGLTGEPAVEAPVGAAQTQPPPAAERPSRAKVSPAARRRAGELGIDPDRLMGTGIDGSVTLANVELEAGRTPPARAKPAAAPSMRRKGFNLDEMRQAIAAAMLRSKREIPHYYLTSTIDMSRSLAWLEVFNKEREPEERLLPAVLLLKATALALREHTQFNGFWEDGRFRSGSGIHIGWAVALRGGGLIAPAIHEVDSLSLPSLMAVLRDLVTRARSGGIRSSEMMDPTVTMTSLGDRGAESVLGIIYPPQVAILGFGQVLVRPWVIEGEVMARPLVTVSLAADHRASDGHAGSLFLSAVSRFLLEPEFL